MFRPSSAIHPCSGNRAEILVAGVVGDEPRNLLLVNEGLGNRLAENAADTTRAHEDHRTRVEKATAVHAAQTAALSAASKQVEQDRAALVAAYEAQLDALRQAHQERMRNLDAAVEQVARDQSAAADAHLKALSTLRTTLDAQVAAIGAAREAITKDVYVAAEQQAAEHEKQLATAVAPTSNGE